MVHVGTMDSLASYWFLGDGALVTQVWYMAVTPVAWHVMLRGTCTHSWRRVIYTAFIFTLYTFRIGVLS